MIRNMDELLLIEKIQKEKDKESFGKVYDLYAKKVYNKCFQMVQNQKNAEDLTHDIFIKVYLNINSFRKESSFATWIYSISYNTCINFLKKEKNHIDLTEEIEEEHTEPEENELFQISSAKIEGILKEIDHSSRMILMLKYQDLMSIKDIAETMNLKESAVKMRIKRAKSKVLIIYNQIKP